MLKIFFSITHSGCSWWRGRQPARMITKQGLAEVEVFSVYDTARDDLEGILNWADVIVAQSPAGIQAVALTLRYQEMGKVVIADYDDLVFACSPFNPGYKTLGTKEVKIKQKDGSEIWLWKDQDRGFSIKDNHHRYRAQIDLMGLIDGITLTNEYLKEKFLENMPPGSDEKSFVIPNSIDFDLFKPFPKRESKKIRIGWVASSSHFNEIWMVQNIIEKVFKKYGDEVIFVELGDVGDLKKIFKDRMEFHSFIDLSIYPLKFASLNLDIGICPLMDDEFNSYKSQLKWSEYAALRIPSVVSDTLPYSCVEEGITGLKAKTEQEFFEKICVLVDNEKLRREIANNAFDKNYKDFNLKTNARMWTEAYENIHSRIWVNRKKARPEPQGLEARGDTDRPELQT